RKPADNVAVLPEQRQFHLGLVPLEILRTYERPASSQAVTVNVTLRCADPILTRCPTHPQPDPPHSAILAMRPPHSPHCGKNTDATHTGRAHATRWNVTVCCTPCSIRTRTAGTTRPPQTCTDPWSPSPVPMRPPHTPQCGRPVGPEHSEPTYRERRRHPSTHTPPPRPVARPHGASPRYLPRGRRRNPLRQATRKQPNS